jgi:hypothetical protein
MGCEKMKDEDTRSSTEEQYTNKQSQKPKDLRDKVEEDRGLIKKIELAIPGFRGYRKREDLRIADSLLRKQLADALGNVVNTLENCRKELSKRMEMSVLEDVKGLVNAIQKSENRVRHAEQGYMGISPDYRIDVEELNRMYEWDLSLLGKVKTLSDMAEGLYGAVSSEEPDMRTDMDHILKEIQEFNSTFNRRVDVFSGLQEVD